MDDVAVFGLKIDSTQAKEAVDQFDRSLDRLSTEGKKAERVNDSLNVSMTRLKRGAGEADVAIARLGKTIGVGLAAGATAAAYAFKTTVDRMDELSKAAQRASMPTEDFSRLAYAADLADVSLQDLQGSMGRLAKAQGDAARGSKEQSRAFDALGIAYKNADGSLRDTKEVFFDFADRFKQFQGSPEAVALGMTLFGRGFQSLVPMLKDGASGLKDAGDAAERFGLVVSTQAGQQAEEFNDNLTRLKGAAEGLKIELFSGLIPQINDLTSHLVDASKASDGFWKSLGTWASVSGDDERNPAAAVERIKGDIARMRRLRDELDPENSLAKRLNDWMFGDVGDLDKQIAAQEARLAYLQRLLDRRVGADMTALGGQTPAPRGGLTILDKPDAKKPRDDLAPVIDAAWQRDFDRMISLRGEAEEFETFIAQVQAHHEQALQAQADAWKDIIDPSRKYARQLEQIRDLVKAGKLTKEQGIDAEFDVESKRNDDQLKAMTDTTKKTSDAARELGLTFQSAFEDAIIGGKKFSDVLSGIGKDLLRLTIRENITKPAANWLSSAMNLLFKANADGGVYQSPSLSAYSSNVYTTPQVFAFARGAGVFGEAGPEAIMPLKRGKDGKLGVSAEGGSIVNITNHYTFESGVNPGQCAQYVDQIKRDTVAAVSGRSAFDDAIFGGKRFRDVLDDIDQELRLTIRNSITAITEPAQSLMSALKRNANGNVYQSPSLSAYANGIYDTPRLFAFAKGAGVFAEDGAEAIMPLKRGKDGKLGVSSEGGGVTIYSTVNAAPGTDPAALKAYLDYRDSQLKADILDGMRRGRYPVS